LNGSITTWLYFVRVLRPDAGDVPTAKAAMKATTCKILIMFTRGGRATSAFGL